jgi:CRISPR-associated endonuclease/helicase Cas3
MMVTFVAQCEKKALNKTRRVLDAFANRLGSRTWQTVITTEGLTAVKKLLRKTATKNTAVSCHWLRSRSRSELLWIVGNRSRFNFEGFVPVNVTEKTIINTQWENDWHYLPLIKNMAALAGLFHDWGKSSVFFQTKLKENKIIGDPLRHEWLSVLFLNVYVNGETDEQWLTRLSNGEIGTSELVGKVKQRQKESDSKQKPLKGLPSAAAMIAWLVLSHHRLPLPKTETSKLCMEESAEKFRELAPIITQEWGYENRFDDFDEIVSRCFEYSTGLPCDSDKWLKYTKKIASRLIGTLDLLERSIKDGSWRLIMHHSRLALMLGDHFHSSQDSDPKWSTNLHLFANTDRATKKLKQHLDEHLLGVAKQAIRNAHLLPAFEASSDELQRAYDVKVLKQKSPLDFRWQDKPVVKISQWRLEQGKKLDANNFGFFAVNMASTGKGKTFANAKIMRALSSDQQSLRYILALGLRTLTLQTGDEYRERIGLGNDELAVLIGSRAVQDLHNTRTKNMSEQTDGSAVPTGSESEETLLDNELVFDSEIPEEGLATILTAPQNRRFLFAPVLSCTIDHLMASTETKRGGRYILPSLRLMSSDLVIDEIDDFDGKDLVAIGRLIHLAGMLGRKVMISSATIPPDLAEGYFNAYQSGWSVFAQMRSRGTEIGCCWVDEFSTTVQSVKCDANDICIEQYSNHHDKFTAKRIKKLQEQTPRRKVNICSISKPESDDKETIRSHFYDVTLEAILEKHHQHHEVDKKSGKNVSLGVVRVANITPCIELTRYLLNCELPDDVEIRTMAYHSQQILIMRSEQEKHLDAVLSRKKGAQTSFDNSHIREHLDGISAKNVIFILVATPVEEVGRDHDFDWAVVEPSSFRSFIQLAGRVLRHREQKEAIGSPNMAILQYNLKGLHKKENHVFCRPGYESKDNPLDTHDLLQLLDIDSLAKRLDATPRISRSKAPRPRTSLVDLEHEVIHQLLTDYEQQGPESLQGWLTSCWWLTAIPQQLVRFRESSPQLLVYLSPEEDGEWKFVEKDNCGIIVPREEQYGITRAEELTTAENQRLWLSRDYELLLAAQGKRSLRSAALTYGEIGLPVYGKKLDNLSFIYSDQLGLMKM